MVINIAIDGTSASGKSTIASNLAKKLGYLHLNTGSLYRAYALKMLSYGVNIPTLEDILKLINTTKVDVKYVNGKQTTLLDDKNVNEFLEDNKVSEMASLISPYVELRNKVVDLQRKLAKENNIVIEGRDIGTKIIPNADYKFFITASDETRAERRFKQLISKEKNVTFEQVLQGLRERDKKDCTREHSPLIKADDAILIDTTNLSLQESLELIMSYIK